MLGSGPESWHPNPDDLLPARRGPAVRHGPVLPHHARAAARPGARGQRVGADLARATTDHVGAAARSSCIDVEVPTHVASLVEFASGPIATLVTSFDVQATRYCNIEVYGTEATLSVPEPEHVRRPGADQAQRRRGVDRHRAAARAPAAAARHRSRRHDVGAAHRARAPHVERARAARARADDRRARGGRRGPARRSRDDVRTRGAAAGRPRRRTPSTTDRGARWRRCATASSAPGSSRSSTSARSRACAASRSPGSRRARRRTALAASVRARGSGRGARVRQRARDGARTSTSSRSSTPTRPGRR